jgi:hypothetical protein
MRSVFYHNVGMPQWHWPILRRDHIEEMLAKRGLGDPLIDEILASVPIFDARTYMQKNHYYDLRLLAGKVPKRRVGRIHYAPLEPIEKGFLKAARRVKRQADALERALNSSARNSGVAVESIAELEGYPTDSYKRLAAAHVIFRCAYCRTEYCAVSRIEYSHFYNKNVTNWGEYALIRWRREEDWTALPVCSEGCNEQLNRITDFIAERREREWQTIRRGQKLLQEARALLRRTEDQKASRLQSVESKPGTTSPI